MIQVARRIRSRGQLVLLVAVAVAVAGCGPVGRGTIAVKSPEEVTKGILDVGMGGPPRLGAPPVSETVRRR